jgi:BirA family biotin operon repressor/biotin-[acetyl-CoA-carboxylase] ligase
VRRFEEIDSTNTYLRAEARQGAPEGVVAVADHQSAGRGRLDRRWEAPPGASLLVSVLFRPEFDPAELHLCTGAVALAGADACASVAGVTASMKWPNDLVVGERKLAGVLAEADFEGVGAGGKCAVVVGIGINVAWPGPPDVGGTCLDELRGQGGGVGEGVGEGVGVGVDRSVLLNALLGALAPRRALLDRADGRLAVAAELQSRCATLGRRVRVELANGTVSGLATGIDDAGHLVVETVDGPRTVAAGDVVHLRPEADEG